jgi:hypothetical protein
MEPSVTVPVSALTEAGYRWWLTDALTRIEHTQEQIMATQDDINAAVTAISATTATIGQQTSDILAWIAAHPEIDTSGLSAAVTALQNAGTALDTAVPPTP